MITFKLAKQPLSVTVQTQPIALAPIAASIESLKAQTTSTISTTQFVTAQPTVIQIAVQEQIVQPSLQDFTISQVTNNFVTAEITNISVNEFVNESISSVQVQQKDSSSLLTTNLVKIEPSSTSQIQTTQFVNESISSIQPKTASSLLTTEQIKIPDQVGLEVVHEIFAASTTLADAISAMKIEDDVIGVKRESSSNMVTGVSFIMSNGGFTTSNIKFAQAKDFTTSATSTSNPYKKITNIAEDRPDIIAVTKFYPLYKTANSVDTENRTKEGLFFDIQIIMKKLEEVNHRKFLKDVSATNSALSKFISGNISALPKTLVKANNITNFLTDILISVDAAKDVLDLRDSKHVVAPDELNDGRLSYFSSELQPTNNPNIMMLKPAQTNETVGNDLQDDIGPIETLVDIGYPEKDIKSNFSSTKIWLQLLFEAKMILRNHSQQMLQQSRNVTNFSASELDFNSRKHLLDGYQNAPPSTLSSLASTLSSELPITLRQTKYIFDGIYSSLSFGDEKYKIALFLDSLSKDFRFSSALANQDNVSTISQVYGYTVQNYPNRNIFDSIFGSFPADAFDFVSGQSNTLVGFTNERVDQSTIARLETEYVNTGNGTITPGSEYYFDSILRSVNGLDSTKISALQDDIQIKKKLITTMFKRMGVFYQDPDQISKDIRTAVLNPIMLFRFFYDHVFDKMLNEVKQDASNDLLSAVLHAATIDSKIREKLFLYVVLRSHKNTLTEQVLLFSQTPFQQVSDSLDKLLTLLVNDLIDFAKSFSTSDFDFLQNGQKLVDVNIIKNSLSKGSYFLDILEKLTLSMFLLFRGTDEALYQDNFRYSGFTDAYGAAVMFDAFNMVVAKMSAFKIAGLQSNQTTTKFLLSPIDSKNNRTFINSVEGLLKDERSRTRRISYSIYTALKTIEESITVLKTKIDDSTNKQTFMSLLDSLGKDAPDLLPLLTNQQVFLALSRSSRVQTAISTNDFFLEPQLPKNSAIDAIKQFMSTPDYTLEKGFNKRIVTVGLPVGFSQRLKRIRKKKFGVQENDVVKVKIYRVNMQYQGLIWKPVEYVFELSRSVCKDLDITVATNNSLDNIINSFPLIDYSQALSAGSQNVTYGYSQDEKKTALVGKTYEFLSSDDKKNIIKSTATSFVLESYLKIMTGLSMTDDDFEISKPIPTVDPVLLSSGMSKQLLNQQANYGSTVSPTSAMGLAYTKVNGALGILATNNLASDVKEMISYIIKPRSFDRVLHMIVDPDDFVLDVNETEKTDFGKNMLQVLKNSNQVGQTSSIDGKAIQSSPQFDGRFDQGYVNASLGLSSGEISFDKYFCVVSTYDNLEE